ncbi:PAS domain-containing sensor histidine kinase [Hymenobacter sp. DH14]|uniref:histidine kinase n=1 Tax=Hymenobacter cyanobacteriorum TaxID=2926463 RepID=A0A9X2AF94_9BACT|nr:PAS domain-containing protein [Hymenobacter cyanobacteriorum]MCI1186233.1 PAS domain-containing sensor histidine kinase [Hymenobacter cyanobacteriorum]
MPTASSAFFADPGLLQAVFEVSQTALCLLRPQPGSDEASDFILQYLNPESQRLLGLPEQPGASLRTFLPRPHQPRLLAFCRAAFAAGTAHSLDVRHPTAGPGHFLRLVARRHGEQLLVSIMESTVRLPQPTWRGERPLPVHALTADRRAHTLAQAVAAESPVGIAVYQGENAVIALANEQMGALWNCRPAEALGRPLLEAVPALRGQGMEHVLAAVQHTRTPFVGSEVAVPVLHAGRRATQYFDIVYQPLPCADGGAAGVVNLAINVTAQVRARQRLLRRNQHLTARVAERTRAVHAAQTDAHLQRHRLERLFTAAPAIIAIFDGPDLVHELANPLYRDLFPGRDVLGRPLLAVVPELAGTAILAYLRRVYQTGVIYHDTRYQLRAQPAGVPDRYLNLICKPRRTADGRVDGVLVFGFDVTAQVLAQQRADALQAEALAATRRQVQERETLYQTFAQTPACIALLYGPDHRFAYCNPAYQRLVGDVDPTGRPVAEALPEAVEQGFLALLDGVYCTGETYYGHEEAYVAHRPGEPPAAPAYFNFTYQAHREYGHIVGVSVFAYEVTPQVRVRQQRQAQQAQLHQLFEAAPFSICLFGGPEFVYELASWEHQALFPDRALRGRPLLEAVPELAGQPVWDVLQRVYRTGATELNRTVRVPLARGGGGVLEDTYFDYIFQARRDDHGAITGVLVFAFDVTEQVHGRQRVQALNQDLHTANAQLTRANNDLAHFIYMASHDLRLPIANLEGLVRVLEEEWRASEHDNATVPAVVAMMHDAVARFQRTLADLTDIAEVQAGRPLTAAAVNLAELVGDICLDMAPLLARMPSRLTVDVAACPTLQFSPKNLRSIVFNLLSNAIKYQDPGRASVVQLRAYRAAGGAASVVEVQDNGLGLRPDQQAQLFGLFQRLHDHVEGSGVGLYMVKKLVENIGGTITVESEAGAGSTFTVVLPD